MVGPYYRIRYRWWSGVDLMKAMKDLKDLCSVQMVAPPHDKNEEFTYRDEREEVKAYADTLTVHLSALSAVLSQKTSVPFTEKDMELRKLVLKMYPRSIPTPWKHLYDSNNITVEYTLSY